MRDILDKLALSAKKRVKSGYYDISNEERNKLTANSFEENIKTEGRDPIIGEIKPGSPSRGRIFADDFDPTEFGESCSGGGVAGFSVLTDPDNFFGSLDNLKRIAKLGKPTLMKDFLIDYCQVRAGKALGADAVLFIYRLFAREISRFDLESGIEYAHDRDLEVLLEVNDVSEYELALETEADMIGINNRDLRSLEVDLTTTERILSKAGKTGTVWAMSGIASRSDVVYLRDAGADAFLVGTSLALSDEPGGLIQQLSGVSDG